MSLNDYLSYLDDLNDKERTIFLYCCLLRQPQNETAKRLKLSIKEVRELYNAIKLEIEVMKLCELLHRDL